MRSSGKAAVLACIASLALLTSACTTVSTDGASASNPAAADAATVGKAPVDEAARALLPAAVRDLGTISIASDPTYPPFEYYAKDNKTIIGWDADMGDAIAQTLGLKATNVPATFDTILPGLSSGKYDLGMSTFSVTPDRMKVVDFVEYLSGGTGLAVQAGNPESLSMEADTLCGKPIAAQKGSIQGLKILPKLSKECTAAGKQAINIKLFPTQSDANLALTSGRIDGVLADSISLAYQGSLANEQFELAAGEDYEPELTGVALAKDSPLRPAVAAAMRSIINSSTYGQINEKWSIPDSALITAETVSGK